METASGARADGAQLPRALDQLDKGDVLMVTHLDRLARSTRDLLNTLATITGKGAGFRSLHVHADKMFIQSDLPPIAAIALVSPTRSHFAWPHYRDDP